MVERIEFPSREWQGGKAIGFNVAFVGMECFVGASKAPMNTLIEANIHCLEQGIDLLEEMPGSVYSRSCPEVFGSSIGGHFRHNLDHYVAFKRSLSTGSIDYDERDRSLSMETDPAEAQLVMRELRDFFNGLADMDLNTPLRIRMDDGGDSTWSATSLRRELQFLLSHTIHHYALVVSIATRSGHTEFPEGFGVAPSTLHYLEAKEV